MVDWFFSSFSNSCADPVQNRQQQFITLVPYHHHRHHYHCFYHNYFCLFFMLIMKSSSLPFSAVVALPLPLLLLLLVLLQPAVVAESSDADGAESAVEIPQQFYGAFKLDHSDNWDDYLIAKGYSDPEMRKKVDLPRFTRILYRFSNGTYRMMVGTGLEGSKWVKGSKKNADWSFKVGKPFVGNYWDGTKHEITFTFDPKDNHLTERHVKLSGNSTPEEFNYKIDEDNNLELYVFFKNVKLVHHYVRTD